MMQESEIRRLDSDLDNGLAPPDDQLAHIKITGVTHATGEALVIKVTGGIHLSTVDRFRAAVVAGLQDMRDTMLIIDLTDVTFLASHGLQVLIEATQDAQQRHTPLRIVTGHTRAVIRPIEMTGLDEALALFNTIDDAQHTPP